jgi:peroxiredoxin
MGLAAGDKVGAFKFADQTGKEWKYPEDFQTGKLAIFFLRHLGCPLCKENIAELTQAASSFAQLGAKLVAVAQATPKRAAEFSAKANLPFLLAPDREKRLYALFQVNRGGFKEFTAPAVLKANIRATLKGHMHGRFEGDEFQVPAAFLLAPTGEVLFAHYGKDISDFGDINALLAKA